MYRLLSTSTFVLLIFVFSNPLFGQLKKVPSPTHSSNSNQIELGNILKKDIALYTNNRKRRNGTESCQPNTISYKSNILHAKHRDSDGEICWLEPGLAIDRKLGVDNDVWLKEVAEVSNLNEQAELKLVSKSEDAIGMTHSKLYQYQNGIKVFDGEIIIHSKEGKVKYQNGKLVSSDLLPELKSAILPMSEVKEQLSIQVPGYDHNWQQKTKGTFAEDLEQLNGELVYYKHEEDYQLAYNIKVIANAANQYEYLVCALTGEVLNSWTTVCRLHHEHGSKCKHHELNEAEGVKETKNEALPPDGPASATARDLFDINRTINTYEFGGNYFMIDASRDMYSPGASELPNNPVGAIMTVDMRNASPSSSFNYYQVVTPNNSWNSVPESVSAHYNGGEVYEYFENVHGRQGISSGQTMRSFVNVSDEDGSSFGNAFYASGLGIFYGNGDNSFFPLGRALDVAGHEMSHGVVDQSANLIYQGESGACNESFADIFGAMVDREDWLIGEDVVKLSAYPSGALRSLSDPHNGAQTGDFRRGWQPKHTNEQYRGGEDNGGVHINSGIPNHAFYLFAREVGKEVAERVFYRALTTCMTRTSGFKQLRFAVVQSAQDLYGTNAANEARQAFDGVGIFTGEKAGGGTVVETNEGRDYLLVSTPENNRLVLVDLTAGEILINPLSTTSFISKPSITDDGSFILFVDEERNIRLIALDWSTNPPAFEESIISNSPIWRNVTVSKDGSRLALLTEEINNDVIIIDFATDDENTYELYNPTYTEGVETGDVELADAMEFDLSGNVLMYDARNRIEDILSGGAIEYWDIGFLTVWNPESNTWALGNIDKLFGSLPDNVSIGNPTFSKNSPNVIAFDVFENGNLFVLGMNIETSSQGFITETNGFSYPNYSVNDRAMVFDNTSELSLDVLDLMSDKISGVEGSAQALINNAKWGVWFTNGQRSLPTSVTDIADEELRLELSPVPAVDQLTVKIAKEDNQQVTALLKINNLQGQSIRLLQVDLNATSIFNLDVKDLKPGLYLLTVESEGKVYGTKFIKAQ